MTDELSQAWTRIQDERREDLLDEIGATWWRVHKLATALGTDTAVELDAMLLETSALARSVVRELS